MAEADYAIGTPDQGAVGSGEIMEDSTIPLIQYDPDYVEPGDLFPQKIGTPSISDPVDVTGFDPDDEIEFISEKEGVKVNIPVSAIPKGVIKISLVVESVDKSNGKNDSGIDNIKKQAAEIGKAVTIYDIFDIYFIDQDAVKIIFASGEAITISIPVQGNSNNVIYIDDTGMIEILPSSLKNGFIMFKVSHFSYYALVYMEDLLAGEAGGSTIIEKPNPQTGEIIFTSLLMILILITGAITMVAVKKNKKTI